MNNEELEQKFSAIVIAIQSEKIDIARQIFNITLKSAVDSSIDKAVNTLNNEKDSLLLEEWDN